MPLARPRRARTNNYGRPTLTAKGAHARAWMRVYADALGLPHQRGTVSAAAVWYCSHLRACLRRAGIDPEKVRRDWYATARVKGAQVPEAMPDLEEGMGGRVNDAGNPD
jgi:hypothetical protein